MSSPKVSIIIPVHNTELYLNRCLDSVLNQTLKEIEIICIIDVFDDGSLQILKDYEAKDSRICVITKDKGSLAAARNEGLKHVKAAYIGFVDSDDYIAPDMYEQMYKAMAENDVDMVMCGTKVLYEGNVKDYRERIYFSVGFNGLAAMNDDFFISQNITAWNKLYKTELINNYSIISPALLYICEDVFFCWCYMSICKNIYYLQKELYYYIRRTGSLMDQMRNGINNHKVLNHLDAVELFYDFLIINNLFDRYKYAFWNCYVKMIHGLFYHGTPETIRTLGLPKIKEFINDKDFSFLCRDTYCLLYELLNAGIDGSIYVSKQKKLKGFILKETKKNMSDMSTEINLRIAGILLPGVLAGFLLALYRMGKKSR